MLPKPYIDSKPMSPKRTKQPTREETVSDPGSSTGAGRNLRPSDGALREVELVLRPNSNAMIIIIIMLRVQMPPRVAFSRSWSWVAFHGSLGEAASGQRRLLFGV